MIATHRKCIPQPFCLVVDLAELQPGFPALLLGHGVLGLMFRSSCQGDLTLWQALAELYHHLPDHLEAAALVTEVSL